MTTFVYNLPVVNGSEDTWGTTINANWTNIGTFIGALDSAELAKLDGLTASTVELNILDGLTASQAELNYVAGVTSAVQTQLNAKADDSTTISAGGGLDGGGNLGANRTISHSNTSSQGSVNNGGNTVIQDISVDTYGHVTSIGSKALSIPAAYTQPTSTGSVGTYALLKQTVTSTARAPGATRAGSGLDYTSAGGDGSTTSPGGTWRIMGAIKSGTGYATNTSVWLRIS